jgi:hypothetical protein
MQTWTPAVSDEEAPPLPRAFDFCIPTRGTKIPHTPDWRREIKQVDRIAQGAGRAVASVRLAQAITPAHFRNHGQSEPGLTGPVLGLSIRNGHPVHF